MVDETGAQLVTDSSLLPGAVEEMLRYFSPFQGITARVATADIRLGDVTIRENEGVVVAGIAADRDDTVFGEPEKLDFRREARHHIAFGYGVHQCLGQNLARAELEIVFETLCRRVPALSMVVPSNELSYQDDSSVYGIHRVLVDATS